MNWFGMFNKKKEAPSEVVPKWAIDKQGNVVGYWYDFLPAEQAAMANIASFEELEIWCKNNLNIPIRYNSSLSPRDMYWFKLDNVRACMSIDPATGQVNSVFTQKPVADICNKLRSGDENLTYEHDTILYKGVPILWWAETNYSIIKEWYPDFKISGVERVLLDNFAAKFARRWEHNKDIAKRNAVIKLLEEEKEND